MGFYSSQKLFLALAVAIAVLIVISVTMKFSRLKAEWIIYQLSYHTKESKDVKRQNELRLSLENMGESAIPSIINYMMSSGRGPWRGAFSPGESLEAVSKPPEADKDAGEVKEALI